MLRNSKIGLRIIFKNILRENDKTLILLTVFYISHKSDIKTFLMYIFLVKVMLKLF